MVWGQLKDSEMSLFATLCSYASNVAHMERFSCIPGHVVGAHSRQRQRVLRLQSPNRDRHTRAHQPLYQLSQWDRGEACLPQEEAMRAKSELENWQENWL